MPHEIEPAVRSAASAFILTNNIQVTFFTFAGGIVAGLLSAWIILLKGLTFLFSPEVVRIHGRFPLPVVKMTMRVGGVVLIRTFRTVVSRSGAY